MGEASVQTVQSKCQTSSYKCQLGLTWQGSLEVGNASLRMLSIRFSALFRAASRGPSTTTNTNSHLNQEFLSMACKGWANSPPRAATWEDLNLKHPPMALVPVRDPAVPRELDAWAMSVVIIPSLCFLCSSVFSHIPRSLMLCIAHHVAVGLFPKHVIGWGHVRVWSDPPHGTYVEQAAACTRCSGGHTPKGKKTAYITQKGWAFCIYHCHHLSSQSCCCWDS